MGLWLETFNNQTDQGNALFEAAPEVVVEVTREFLRG